MELIKSLILGLIQGLTEFLPVSSSGHLKIFEILLNFKETNLLYDLILHFASLIAILIVYKNKISHLTVSIFRNIDSQKYLLYIFIGIIPAIFCGLMFENVIETSLNSLYFVSIMLFITGLFLFSTKFANNSQKKINLFSSVLIGLVQIFALLPGISRSGITISAGINLKIKKEDVVDFSFMMAIPLIGGATLYKLLKSYELLTSENISLYLVGFLFSLISSIFAIKVILKIVKENKLHYFSYYCFILAITIFIFKISNG